VGEYKNKTAEISFTGTPMYTIVLKDNGGSTITRESGSPFSVPAGYTVQSFTDKTGAPGIMKCIPMTGDLDFIVPAVSKNAKVSFIVNSMIDAPALITYSWSAPYFSPTTYEGTTFTSTAPGALDTYSITLTAHAEGYCNLVKTKDVEVLDCTVPGSTVNFTAFNPCASAVTTGTVWYLTDTRTGGNNNTYKVKKLADGHIWMVQDMKFGTCPASTYSWYNDNSAAATTHTPTVYTGYVGHCRSSIYTNAGYLYNWPAAMQNKDAYSGSSSDVGCSGTSAGTTSPNPGACQGICPAGWHIPTGYSSGEYQALHDAIGGCSTKNDDCWDANSAWEGVSGGGCNESGALYNSQQGTEAIYWSSTYYSSSTAFYLYNNASEVNPGTYRSNTKNYGRSVRCVMNY
jgi:uncharacterized protein (TIGR02145 family)